METLVIHEVKAYLAYSKLGYRLRFWRNYDGAEIGLVCETRTGFMAVEVKAAREWQRRFGRELKFFQDALPEANVRTYGVFRGPRRVDVDGISVLPLDDFLDALWQGAIIS